MQSLGRCGFRIKKNTNELTDTVYDLAHSPEAKSYWMQKDNVSYETIDSINWGAIKTAMKESKRGKRIFISKHTSGMCGVGRFMKRWKLHQDYSCPRCGLPEDSAHVWACHGEGADNIWETALNNLEGWFNLLDTDPDLQHLVLQHLQSWRDDTGLRPYTNFMLEGIVQSQSRVGWRRFFEGWLVMEWTEAQQAYYHLIKSKRSGKRWTVELIKKTLGYCLGSLGA